MKNPPSTSLLTVLSLYTGLRRSGSSELAAQDKLRGLVVQLAIDDRKELSRAIHEWEGKHGQDIEQHNAAKDQQRAQRAVTDNVLDPVHGVLRCPNCGKMNDSAQTSCLYCGNLLVSSAVNTPPKTRSDTWFGPDSKLVLTINGIVHPAEVAVRNVITFGRHTPEDRMADIDLSEYRGDIFGVSRTHASIKHQNSVLTIVDLRSTNHTYLNGNQLKDGEARTLSNGDKIRLGNLEITVVFKHLK